MGDINILNHNIQKLNEVKLSYLRNENIGFVFQFHHLLPDFSAFENVLIPTWIRGDEDMKSYAIDLFERLDLINRKNNMPSELSGGERSRVALIRAIINKPALLLADEPTGNLDSNTGQEIINYMRKLQDEMGTTIITVTHDDKMLTAADRMAWIRDGLLERVANREEIEIQVGSIKEH